MLTNDPSGHAVKCIVTVSDALRQWRWMIDADDGSRGIKATRVDRRYRGCGRHVIDL